MSMRVEGSFEVTSWDEHQAGGLEDTGKVSRATIGQRFTGGIEAETVADMVMTYRDDGTAEFVGYHRVEGRMGDKGGSFVLQASGSFDGTDARTNFEVVPGSARGELAGLRGTGTGSAGHGSTGVYGFDVDL
ncbi:MAG TPA: DUF3224 domain-containing protein [Acidimicrobiales bacterium]|jgi:hypothetical protein|nr:DUF3224 domain-containing protein [Acidimicrobiales bacterium]